MTIQEFKDKCLGKYKTDLDLLPNYNYYDGGSQINQINPIVPSETEINKFMIVGAYPSANFTHKVINGRKYKVPKSDIIKPFSSKETKSGKILDKMLEKIGIKRSDCWITNLVKVFLFKQGHIWASGITNFEETRSKYPEYAKKSIKWLFDELTIARPEIIITLSDDVYAILRSESNREPQEGREFFFQYGDVMIQRSPIEIKEGMAYHMIKLSPDELIDDIKLNNEVYKIIPLPHPHFFFPKNDSDEDIWEDESKWEDYFLEKIVPSEKWNYFLNDIVPFAINIINKSRLYACLT